MRKNVSWVLLIIGLIFLFFQTKCFAEIYQQTVSCSDDNGFDWDSSTTQSELWSVKDTRTDYTIFYNSGVSNETRTLYSPVFNADTSIAQTIFSGYDYTQGISVDKINTAFTPSDSQTKLLLRGESSTSGLALEAAEIHLGNTVLENGISSGKVTLSGQLVLDGTNAEICNNQTDTLTISSQITGTGTLVKTGSGTVYLTNPGIGTSANTFSGGIDIREGTLAADSPEHPGSGSITLSKVSNTLGTGTINIASGATLAILNQKRISIINKITGTGKIDIHQVNGGDTSSDSVYLVGTSNNSNVNSGDRTIDMEGFYGTVSIKSSQVFAGLQGTTGEVTLNAQNSTFVLSGTSSKKGEFAAETGGTYRIGSLQGDVNSVLRRGGQSTSALVANFVIGENDKAGQESYFYGTIGSGSTSSDKGHRNIMGITKAGEGTLVLTGTSNSYLNGTKILSGTLAINDGRALGDTSTATALASNVLDLSGGTLQSFGKTVTVNNNIIVTKDSHIDAKTDLLLNGNLTSDSEKGYHKLTIAGEGKVEIDLAGTEVCLGTLDTTQAAGGVHFTGTNQTFSGNIEGDVIVAEGTTTTFTNSRDSAVTKTVINGSIHNYGTSIFTAEKDKVLEVVGDVIGGSVCTSGPGELDFQGALEASLHIESEITFSPGTALGTEGYIGSTTVNGDFTLAKSGQTSQAQTAGITTMSDVLISDTSTIRFDLAGDFADLLTVSGDATFQTGANILFNVTSPLTADDYLLVDASQGTLNTVQSEWDAALSSSSLGGSDWYIDMSNPNQIYLKKNATGVVEVPEPTAWLLLIVGCIGLYFRNRRIAIK